MNSEANKILVVVPHQDDELDLVGNCLDAIRMLGDIVIIYTSLESGKKGAIRKKEALNACSIYGIKKENVVFLGFPDCPDGMNHYFLSRRTEMVEKLEKVIEDLRPKYIFGVDFDYHPDHRAACLALDEAIGKILKKDVDYQPFVLKGFCYETAYYGVEDYIASKFGGMTKKKWKRMSNRNYEWNDRYSVFSNERSRLIWQTKCYKALRKHKSQYAILHARSIINRDNVFWLRRTDNLMNKAKVTVSSGDAAKLSDFMIIDTNNIAPRGPEDVNYSRAIWTPDKNDANPSVRIAFSEAIYVREIKIYSPYGVIYKDIIDRKISSYEIKPKANWEISEIEILGDSQKLPEDIFVQKRDDSSEHTLSAIDFINNIGYAGIVFWTKIIRKLRSFVNE